MGSGNPPILGQVLAGSRPAVAHLRIETRPRGHEEPLGLGNVGGGDLHVLVVGQRVGDELVEHRVVELLPPFGVGGLGHVLRLEAEGLGGIDDRTLVVGPDGAAGYGQGN